MEENDFKEEEEKEDEEEGGLFTLKRVSFGLYYFVASSIAVALLCDFAYSSKVGGYGSTSFRLRLFYFSKELLFFFNFRRTRDTQLQKLVAQRLG